ncbi:hypothetical protein BGZ65_005156 [Modicella reniformis]|uniref:Uncharacterized protein n=1 Tax=Modicella reniformis TaxID=1440133 RepID=A0A9P6LYM0_9FUNG|nr:hypothetical protein BGZ65_005156 [Modicella reniformis]
MSLRNWDSWTASNYLKNVSDYFKREGISGWTFSTFRTMERIKSIGKAKETWRTSMTTLINHPWTTDAIKMRCIMLRNKNDCPTEAVTIQMKKLAMLAPAPEGSESSGKSDQSTWKIRSRHRNIPKKLRRATFLSIRQYKLENDDAEDIDPVVNNFRFVSEHDDIFDLLEEMSPNMRRARCESTLAYDVQYVWSAIDQIHVANGNVILMIMTPRRFHWGATYIKKKQLEGWMISFVHSHVLNILHTIPDTLFQITEKKPRKKRAIPELMDIRHDGILYHLNLRKELLAMEAKPRASDNQEKDVAKLEYALATMLTDLVRKDGFLQNLRSFGILISGFEVTFFEARFVDNCILMYPVYQGEMPKSEQETYKLADLLVMFVLFKRRIVHQIRYLTGRNASARKPRPDYNANLCVGHRETEL